MAAARPRDRFVRAGGHGTRRLRGIARSSSVRARVSVATAKRRLRGAPVVGLVGFYGRGNFGDELFADVFREHLGAAGPLRMLADRPVAPYFSQPVPVVVAGADAILIGGGDLLPPWYYPQSYWHRAFLARPVLVAGIGVPTLVGRRADPDVLARYAAFLRHPNVRYLGVRDQASADWIARHLGPDVPIRVHPDLVCARTLPPVPADPGPPTLGIVTRARPGHEDDYAGLAALAARALDRGMRVRHIVLGTGVVGERDAHDALRLRVPGKETVVTASLDDLCAAIGSCRVLASMKFHGSVVATMYGVPSLCLMPTAKNRRFFAAIGRTELVTTLRDPRLADRLSPLPPRIAPQTVDGLRRGALTAMTELREALAEATERTSRPR